MAHTFIHSNRGWLPEPFGVDRGRVMPDVPVHGRGHVVAAVGLRHGRHLLGIRAFLDAGCKVAAFDLGTLDDDAFEEEQQAQIDEMLAEWPRHFLVVDTLDGERVADALAKGAGARHVLATTDEQLGRTDVVYLGQWWGVVDYDVGADFVRALAARGGGELIVTEADATTSDHLLRWMACWVAEPTAQEVYWAAMRDPLLNFNSRASKSVTAGANAWEVLTAAGWNGPLSLQDADRVAGEQIAAGTDLMAGRRCRIQPGDFRHIDQYPRPRHSQATPSPSRSSAGR